jgi:NAD(P)-dependent dehydrogenase (short-subunit alcohol dehydrogenase family)
MENDTEDAAPQEVSPRHRESGSPRDERRVVVITGASGGIGRATARAFARRGDAVALLARGEAGLAAASADVERLGGRALAIPTDVADYDAVALAAAATERDLGPIDVWVNAAFASVFAPFEEIAPTEFRRITDVTYLGFVHGTRVALSHMRPRDRGTIIQVGSALGDRAIPLQSAYCGAKHAINGFTSSLRVELKHEGSHVHVTVVQLPAVNTPQFSWVRSRLPHHPQPVPPIFQPEMAADAIVFAADHPGRKQYWVGTSTALTVLANRVAPALLDRYLARTGYRSQQTDSPVADRTGNLWHPRDGASGHDFGAHGEFDDRAHRSDPQLALSRHRGLAWGATALGVAGWRGTRAALRHMH